MGQAYYVDPSRGDDRAAGRTRTTAWRTLARASRASYHAGDRLLLAGRLVGTLRLSDADGLTVASADKRATLDGGAGDGIVVEGGKGLRFSNLIVVGAGRKANDGTGILLRRTEGARVSDVQVSGYRLGGVEVGGSSGTVLERIVATENGSAGISVSGGWGDLPRSKDVTIRDCRALDNPGDPKNLTNHSGNGIVVGGVDGCLIERCEAANNGWDMPRTGNGPVGIWAWDASRVVIQRCISHDNKSPGTDGGGFDFDGGVTDSVLQHNLSYGNAGAGYLLCQYEGAATWRNNVVRHNVSYEDGSRNFHSGIALYLPVGMTNMSGAVVERNTVVNPRFAVATMGDVPGVAYRNNVFVSGEDMLNVAWGEAGFRKATFRDNLAWSPGGKASFLGKDSPFPTAEAWTGTGGRIADPRLRLPKSVADLPKDPQGLAALAFFRSVDGRGADLSGNLG